MLQYNCQEGQSLSDVCLNTYGSLDFYVKMLTDNNLSPEDTPNGSTIVNWDETLVKNQTIQQLTTKNKIIFATLTGFGIPEQINPFMSTYVNPFNTHYTASADNETIITLVELQGATVEILKVTLETKELLPTDYTFNNVTGIITLVNSITMSIGQALFVLYKKTITI